MWFGYLRIHTMPLLISLKPLRDTQQPKKDFDLSLTSELYDLGTHE